MSDLTRDVLKEFADIVIDDKNKDKEVTAYGTTVESDGVDYVKLDGSNLLTPITTTTDIKPGERVLVMIKNHQAIIIGNSSNPSAGLDQVNEIQNVVNADQASIKELVANNITVNEQLNANKANIDDLLATNVVIEGKLEADRADITRLDADKLNADEADIRYAKVDDLTATNADIVNLNADYAKFKDASVKRLDANEASIKDLDAKKLSAEDADIKYAQIDKLDSIYVQIGSLEGYKATIENLFSSKAEIDELKSKYIEALKIETDAAKITQLNALLADIETLNTKLAQVEQLVAGSIITENIDSSKANIDELTSNVASIGTAIIDIAKIEDLTAAKAEIENLLADEIVATLINVETLKAKSAEIEQLKAYLLQSKFAEFENLTVSQLEAVNATIGTLDALVANIKTIISGSIGTGELQSIHITSQNVVIDDAVIKSANIESLDVDKLDSGTINTNKFTIQSEDGGIQIVGSTQQFTDDNGNVRLQMGKDAQGNFNFIIFGEDGTTAIYNQNGITKDAVPDGLIVDQMVSDDAAIQAKKVQYVDKEGNKTLQTVIETEQGRIDTLIKETTIINDDGTTTTLKDAYNQTKSTVEGNTTTISNVETTINELTDTVETFDSRITEIKTTTDGISSTVSKASSDAENALTQATQASNKFSWIVKSGTDETNFELTDRTVKLTADYINQKGLVTYEGLASSVQETLTSIDETNTTVKNWISEAIVEDTSTINGGYIKANTININHLMVEDIFATGTSVMNIIESREINADLITSGLIRSNLLELYGLKVLQKETEQETLSITDDGDVTLRGTVESYGYNSGKTGWSINSTTNSAEFNDVIVRGSVITNDGGIVSSGGSGRNLQLNTSFYNSLYNWARGDCYSVDTEFQYKGTNSVKFTRSDLTADSVQYLYSGWNKIPCTSGKSYTAQANFYTKDYSAIDGNGVIFGIYFYTSDNTSAEKFRKKVSFVNNQWVYESITAVAPENAAYVAIVTGSYRNGTFWEARPKIEEGGVATDWSLAPEDKMKQVRFWSGASYEERESAPWIVYNDGSMIATKGTFGGVFTGDIKIGNISIIDPSETSGGDAILTIQNGQNGIKKVRLKDAESSSFAQNIIITDDFYSNKIELNQNGYGMFYGGINVGESIILEDNHLVINGFELKTGSTGYVFNVPQVNIGSINSNSLFKVYGQSIVNGDLKVTKKINYNDVVECTIKENGIDFDFIN